MTADPFDAHAHRMYRLAVKYLRRYGYSLQAEAVLDAVAAGNRPGAAEIITAVLMPELTWRLSERSTL